MLVTCLIGDPVAQSVSPYLYDMYAALFGLEYSHVKLKVDKNDPQNIVKAIDALRVFNMLGANVTLPYKRMVMSLVDELDQSAEVIGAVNTIINRNGVLRGYNTDGFGAIKTIETNLKEVKESDNVVVIGAGGAARAVLYEVMKRTKNVTVLNRSQERLQDLIDDLKQKGKELTSGSLNQESLMEHLTSANFVINTTSVGMTPEVANSPVSEEIFAKVNEVSPIKDKFFFDVIFNPSETMFIKVAKKYGAKTVGGMRMMIYQGFKSFEIWTGKEIPESMVEEAYKVLISKLNEN